MYPRLFHRLCKLSEKMPTCRDQHHAAYSVAPMHRCAAKVCLPCRRRPPQPMLEYPLPAAFGPQTNEAVSWLPLPAALTA